MSHEATPLPRMQSWLESELGKTEEELIALAEMNSGSRNLEGLCAVAEWLRVHMRLESAQFSRVALPKHQRVLDDGSQMEQESGDVLRWDFQPEAKRRVLLVIHYDTVFGAKHRFQECRKISQGKWNGPGVADAKGGILVLRNALLALEQIHWQPTLGWTVVLNPDEEIGSLSSSSYLQSIAPKFDFGLLFEPALPSGQLVSTRKGSGNFDLVCHGVAAHAGRHFDEGKNAIALLCDVLNQLHARNGLREGTTINLGSVLGGGPVNVVPDLALGRFNIRMPDEPSLQWILGELDKIVEQANNRTGFRVEQFGGVTSPPKERTDRLTGLMQALEHVHRDVYQEPIRWTSTGGVCDGNKLAAAGLPNIDTLGPIGGGLHSSDEWVELTSIPSKALVVANLLWRYDQGEMPWLDRPT